MRKTILLALLGALVSFNVTYAAALPFSLSNHTSHTVQAPQLPLTPFYLGLQAGYADLHYDKSWLNHLPEFESTTVGHLDNDGLAGGVFGGYYFNPFFALELDYIYLPRVYLENINDTKVDEKFSQEIYDLFAKFVLPINRLHLFAKAGAAWIYRTDFHITAYEDSKNHLTHSNLVPTVGAGAGYRLTDHIFADAVYAHYFPLRTLKPVDLLMINLTYRF